MKKYINGTYLENNINGLIKVSSIISAIIDGIKDMDELYRFINVLLDKYHLDISYNIVFYKTEIAHKMYIRFIDDIGALELILTNKCSRFMGDE